MDSVDQNVPAEAEMLSFRVDTSEENIRLDSYLASRIEGWSRARLQRLIEDEDVLVNGEPAKPSYKLRALDEIEVELVSAPLINFAPENIPLNIIHEDDDIIVVNKPPGLVVHPAAGTQSGTLANALSYHFQNLSKHGGVVRPGIVHRLDKDTSGLLVAAKTESAHMHLSDQFRSRAVSKSYVALVYGIVNPDRGRISEPIARDPRNRTRMAVIRGGRGALTLFKTRRNYDSFTLLDVDLKTGRTHQIRVHLSWLKHPIVGDQLYGGGRENNVRDPELRAQLRKLGRQFLHAEKLSFHHPRTEKVVSFEAPLPEDLNGFLQTLERKST
jgi:23S rRNA pseudouridine1911/1915/1917 synthase